MNATTYFRAMNNAQSEMDSIRISRGIGWGIAVEKDYKALHWQHRNRQYLKFKEYVFNCLLKYDAMTFMVNDSD